MSGVDERLLPGERIVYRARRHATALLPALAVAGMFLAAVALLLPMVREETTGFAVWMTTAAFALLGLPSFLLFKAHYATELTVTDARVLARAGWWLARYSREAPLRNVDSIEVIQSTTGRLLGYGSVVVNGTSGTQAVFNRIANPLAFQRAVQAQMLGHGAPISPLPGAGSPAPTPPAGSNGAGPHRDERECPWCAELILARAVICRHCGRDVHSIT